MEDPGWTRVLSQLYKRQGEFKLPLRKGSDERIAVEPTDLGDMDKEKQYQEEKLSENIIFLEEQGLITTEETEYETTKVVNGKIIQENPGSLVLELTKKGFDVAHEREIAKSQQETNERSARLSAYLVIGIIIQALATFTNTDGLIMSVLYSVLILGLLTLVLIDLGPYIVE